MRPRGAGLGRGSRRQAEAAKTSQRLLLKGRWGGRRGKLRLQVGWDNLDQQTALATLPSPGSLPAAWPHRSGPARPSACAVLRHWSPGCAQLSPPPAERKGRRGCAPQMSLHGSGCLGLRLGGEASELRCGAQLWTVQFSLLPGLLVLEALVSPSTARCQVRPEAGSLRPGQDLPGCRTFRCPSCSSAPDRAEPVLLPSCAEWTDGWTAAGTRTRPRARPAGRFWARSSCPRRPRAGLPHASSSGFIFALNSREISNSFSS